MTMLKEEVMKDKIRTDKICEVCRHHTVMLKKKIRGKDVLVCIECHTIQK